MPDDAHHVNPFCELEYPPRWVPWLFEQKPDKVKPDKVPHNCRHGLSTAELGNWMTLATAQQLVAEWRDLQGVGLVMTQGIIDLTGQWQLIGLDFDDVDFTRADSALVRLLERLDSYTEVSPSGKGLRVFVWVRRRALEGLADAFASIDGCHHAELYIGSAARFLTVTFDALNPVRIRRLDDETARLLTQRLNKATEADLSAIPYDPNCVRNLLLVTGLRENQWLLVRGKIPQGQRNEVVHGLFARLMDLGFSKAAVKASALNNAALVEYLAYHRKRGGESAEAFLDWEINKAYLRTKKAQREGLAAYGKGWDRV